MADVGPLEKCPAYRISRRRRKREPAAATTASAGSPLLNAGVGW
jgi:hypothetical protein